MFGIVITLGFFTGKKKKDFTIKVLSISGSSDTLKRFDFQKVGLH